jgi:DNA-binding transcriptional LysR family regulator
VGFLQLPLGDDDTLDLVLQWPLIEESYVAIVARRHLAPDHPGERCSDELLARLPIALDVSAACAMLVSSYLQARIGRFDAHYRADDATMIQLVAEGAALGLLPRSAATSLPETVALLEVDDPPVRVLTVGIAPTSLKVPAVRAFLGELGTRYPETCLPPGPAWSPPAAVGG